MKNILIILLILGALALGVFLFSLYTGVTVGVIGSADGPTQIIGKADGPTSILVSRNN